MKPENIIATIIDESGEFCIRIVNCFPPSVPGVIAEDCDCYHSIYINGLLPIETQRAALAHELSHHYRNDFVRFA